MASETESKDAVRRRARIGIGNALAFSFGSLVFVAVSALLALNFWSGRETALELLRDQIQISVDLLENRVKEHLDPVVAANRKIAEMIAGGAIPRGDRDTLFNVVRGAMAATPQITGMAVIFSDGVTLRINRTKSGLAIRQLNWRNNQQMRESLNEARKRREPFWGKVFWSDRLKTALLTRRAPIYRGAAFRGMVVTAVRVADLSRFLDEIDSESTMDHSFLLYGRDLVLAHSNMSSGRFPRSPGHALPRRDQVADLVLSKIWEPGLARGHLKMPDNVTRSFLIDVLTTSYAVMYRPMAGYGDKTLIAGRYRALEGRFGVFDRLVYAGFAGMGVLLLALVAAYVIGRLITASLGSLATAAERIRVLDMEPPPTVNASRLRELDDTADAFNAMVAGVRWFETYVPRSIVRDLVKPGGESAAQSGERMVTVLFTDIRRFTSLAESMPAEETAAFLNRHFTMLASCIEAEEGTIDKYIGDSVMAFWGAPHPIEDHAERACRAALAMKALLAEDNAARAAQGLQPVEIGIGIHCGKVIAGNIGAPGRVNYTLVGDTVNTAQRLEQLTKTVGRGSGAAKILVSVEIARQLSGNYQAVPAGTHEVRGRFQTVDVFEIL